MISPALISTWAQIITVGAQCPEVNKHLDIMQKGLVLLYINAGIKIIIFIGNKCPDFYLDNYGKCLGIKLLRRIQTVRKSD